MNSKIGGLELENKKLESKNKELESKNDKSENNLSKCQKNLEYYSNMISTAVKHEIFFSPELEQDIGGKYIDIEQKIELSDILVKTAREVFNKNEDYHLAIRICSRCLSMIEKDASREQLQMTATGIPFPKNELDMIINIDQNKNNKMRLINNAGVCWFLMGRAFEQLKNLRKAIESYGKAEFYTLARFMTGPPGVTVFVAKSAHDKRLNLEKYINKTKTVLQDEEASN